jgi:hypothetical protein
MCIMLLVSDIDIGNRLVEIISVWSTFFGGHGLCSSGVCSCYRMAAA